MDLVLTVLLTEHLAPGPYNLDEFTFDISLTFTKGKYSEKVIPRSKVSSSKFYGPGPGLFIKQYFVDIHLKEAFIKKSSSVLHLIVLAVKKIKKCV